MTFQRFKGNFTSEDYPTVPFPINETILEKVDVLWELSNVLINKR